MAEQTPPSSPRKTRPVESPLVLVNPRAVPKGSGEKRSDGDIRQTFAEEGARLLKFSAPANASDKAIKEWMIVEKYGFQVTNRGCILPYDYYRRSTKASSKFKGHQRAAQFFYGIRCNDAKVVNEYGWDCTLCISHTCHDGDCVNPLHLIMEEKWRNWKRNYCGLLGVCDCGNALRCLFPYRSLDWRSEHPQLVVSEKVDIEIALAEMPAVFPFVIRSKNYYSVEALKALNRQKRRNAEKKHKKQHDTKTLRKARRAEHFSSSGRGSGRASESG
jgi:hypothetical protein